MATQDAYLKGRYGPSLVEQPRKHVYQKSAIVEPTSNFDELKVVDRTPIFDIKSVYGKTEFRDKYTGNVTFRSSLGSFEVSSQEGDGVSEIQTLQQMDYSAGTGGQAGIGFRFGSNTEIKADDDVRWGILDNEDGMYFGRDTDGLYVAVQNNGETPVKFYRSKGEWYDPLDGSGTSRLSFEPFTHGYIYQIEYTWYGYGPIDFIVNAFDQDNKQHPVLVKRYKDNSRPTVANPNLPITVTVDKADNGGSSVIEGLITGRQLSIVGAYQPAARITAPYRYMPSVTIPPFDPPNGYNGRLFMVCKIKGDTGTAAFSRITALYSGMDMAMSGTDATDILLSIVMADDYTGSAGFDNNTLTTASETGIETANPSNEDYTHLSNPIIVSTVLLNVSNSGSSGGGGGQPDAASSSIGQGLRFDVPLTRGKRIAVVLGSPDNASGSGSNVSGNVNVYGFVNFSERW